VQLAALGIAEVIVRRASPAGLMQKCAAEHRSGAARALASLAIARRASWLGPAWLGALNRRGQPRQWRDLTQRALPESDMPRIGRY
jgi:hypothetical protein